MTLALLVGLFVTAAPVSAGTNAWSKFAIPSTTGMVLDSGDVTGPMAMGSDGTVWAGRGTGVNTGLIKSTDFGATWAMVTTFPAITTPIMDIVVSSIDPLQVYVTDGADIYKTNDGGTTWVTLSALFTSLGVSPSLAADAFTMTATGVGADSFTMTATGVGADSFTMTATVAGTVTVAATSGTVSIAVTTEVGGTATTVLAGVITFGDVGDIVTVTSTANSTAGTITPGTGASTDAVANDPDGDATVVSQVSFSVPDLDIIAVSAVAGLLNVPVATEVGGTATSITGGPVTYYIVFGDIGDIVTFSASSTGTSGSIFNPGGLSTNAVANDSDGDATVSATLFGLPDNAGTVTVAATSGSVSIAVTTEVGATATTEAGGVITFGDVGDIVTVTSTASGTAGTITPVGGTSTDALSVDIDGDATVVSQTSFSLPDASGTVTITSIDVGYIGTDAYIFAATSTFGNSGGGGVYVAQEAVFGMPWSDMLVDTDRAVAWGTTDVTEVMVDPTNFGTTQMVMAVATDTGATATMVTTKYGGAQWDATVPGVTLPGVTANLYGTSTWLPSDFSSSLASGNMQCFIGVDAMTAAQGDVFWVIFGTPGTAFDLNVNGATGMGVSSLDGIGPGNSASMLASGYSASATTVPVVLASSAGGAIWTANVKAPTGGATPLGPGTALSEVLIDPVTGNAIVATHGTDSAVSASTDWSVWNGVSLINATINAISDLSVLGSTVCMVTNQTAGNIDSFWKNSGGVWMRILSSATFGSAFDTHEYADGAHFLTNMGGTAIYRSLTGGATWSTLVSAVPGAITAWEVVDANTIVVGGGANTIYQTTNGGVIWFTRTATGLGTPVDFASDAASGDILAASCHHR
jgi:hypothetical protein